MHIVPPIPPNPMDELEKNRKRAEEELSGKELYELKKGEKGKERQKGGRKEKLGNAKKKTVKYTIYAVAGLGIIGGVMWFASSRPNLPTTASQGHAEGVPSAHIVTTPIPDNIQRHMIEHADGNDSNGSGIIIQYNCDDYDCEPDLIEKLTDLVLEYPRNVYLAPNSYDGKIILTKLGRRKVLDEVDEQAIRDFIGN